MGNKRAYGQILILHTTRTRAERADVLIYSLFSRNRLVILRSSRTSDDLHKFASDDGLTSAVEENLKPVDHVACVLGSVL